MTLQTHFQNFSSLPKEAILKTDLLRQGVHFTREALEFCSKFKPKSYFIFSFDRVTQKDLSDLQKRAAPEEFVLTGGPWDLKRTVVSTRLNPKSPYVITMQNDKSVLTQDKNILAEVSLNKTPKYYEKNLKSGKPIIDIAPTIEWGYLVYLTVFRLCQYWGEKEECQFCDINENYRQQKKEGRSYTGVKSIEEIVEALSIINETDSDSQAYTVTGGSVTTDLQGNNEAEFYAQYACAIEEKFPGRWIGKAVVQALPLDEVKILKRAGYQIYHPNYEVWDRKLFSKICPGKDRYVGHDEWMRRIVDAAEVFGPSQVIPNFVAGIEMAKPYGYTDVEDAVASTAEGLDYFMSKGICPRFTVWCVEQNTTLSHFNDGPPPLGYYLRLLEVYRDTFFKYRLPVPPGYGEAGVGKAVFSVSAFMDVL